jgi:hypothetical protein
MEDRNKNHNRGWTGLAKHSSTVSLAPARAVSSHARRLYLKRYHGRYRYARFVFCFDLALLAIAAILAIFDMNLMYQRYLVRPAGLELMFEAPAIKASDVTPIQLTVKSSDGKTHNGVMLRWHLPAWVEVVEAYPRFAADGSIALGAVKPGVEKRSRLLVRVRGTVGKKVPFGFMITQYDPFLLALSYFGSETRTIEQAALAVRAAVPGAQYQSGASVPLIVENAGRSIARSVTLRLASKDGAPSAELGKDGNFSLGDLEPGGKRVVFVELGGTQAATFDLGLELQDAAQVVQKYALGAASVAECNFKLSNLEAEGGGFKVDYAAAGRARLLVVGGPLAAGAEAYQDIELNQVSGTYHQAVPANAQRGSWEVVPIDLSGVQPCVGLRRTLAAANSLPATVEARYYALTGDQLGVGPLPPVVGEKTSYWIVWSIGPFNSDLKDARLFAHLPSGVRATGKYSATVPGDFKFAGDSVEWQAPDLKLIGAEKINLAFEVILVPRAEQTGSAAPLLGKTRVTAKTTQGNVLDFELPAVDTDLAADAKAQGKGKVEQK